MENQTLSSSSSSTAKPEKRKSLSVAIEESKKKATKNKNLKLGSHQDVTSERRVEIPSFRSGPVPSEIPRPSIKLYTCYFCQKWFVGSQEFSDHLNAHKQEAVWEEKRNEMEADFPGAFSHHYLDKPHILLGGYSQDAGFGSGPVRRGSEIMKFYPPQPNRLYTCHFCPKWFTDAESFLGHQNAHKQARELEKQRKEMESHFPGLTFWSPYLDKPARFFPGNTSTSGNASNGPVPFPSNNNTGNVLSEKNLISKIGMNNDVEIDDEDQTEEGKYKSWGKDLSLSL